MDLDKIISLNRPKYDLWNRQFDEYLEAQYEPDQLSRGENERIFFQSNDLLMDIARNFFSYGKFKDKWDTSKCYANVFGQSLLLKSEKMDLTFQWGADRDSFYLESYITCAENLRYMNDEFWALILELKKQGEFDFSGMGCINIQERPYFENKTSTIFQMVRNFMLFQVEGMSGTNYQQPPSLELGHFTIRWSFKTDWENLVVETCKTFKILYAVNYQLWKITDLANKKAAKDNSGLSSEPDKSND